MAPLTLLALLLGCPSSSLDIGEYVVDLDRGEGTFTVTHSVTGRAWEDIRLLAGEAEAKAEMQFGSFRFTEHGSRRIAAGGFGPVRGRGMPVVIDVLDDDGDDLGTLVLAARAHTFHLEWSAVDPAMNRLGWSAPCDPSDHFLGLGSHAMDVDHVGQAFPLWVSEPGIGKVETEAPPDDWYLTGTRHASSYPVPFLLRPHRPQGILLDTSARIDLDLCASDPDRFSAVAWEPDTLRTFLFDGWTPLDPIRRLTETTGRAELPPPWIFAPWNDAIRGSERVREVAETLREAGAPSSVLWTEDWKGAEQTPVGYHLGGEWTVDRDLYPDLEEVAADLEDQGFKFFAYFSPFVRSGTHAWEEAVADDVLIRDEAGEVYTFTGVAFSPESLLDLSDPAARAWAQDRMQAALDLGFDGWMADYAEWLPTDAVLTSGADPLLAHNLYPEWWQDTNAALVGDEDTSFFVRSGWSRTAGKVPVVWAGDQRTSFDPDDGLPTVLARGLGMAASGVPYFTHDVAGYQSVGNPPSDKELWFRWASLGAFTPILRTHHGAFDDENWQFDRDEETLAHWVAMARAHTRLFPYRYGLAARAADEGIPMILPIAFRFDDEDWGRMDAWMLGDALLVAPVLERGAESRHVRLPDEVQWYDWWTHERAATGTVDAAVDEIPVFAAAGTTVPAFAEIPDTLTEAPAAGLRTLADVDGARVVTLFGGGGPFTEADGTSYTPTGTPTGPGEVTETLTEGAIEVAGVTVAIEGPVERTYTLVVVE